MDATHIRVANQGIRLHPEPERQNPGLLAPAPCVFKLKPLGLRIVNRRPVRPKGAKGAHQLPVVEHLVGIIHVRRPRQRQFRPRLALHLHANPVPRISPIPRMSPARPTRNIP